jgi:hypothetical protein
MSKRILWSQMELWLEYCIRLAKQVRDSCMGVVVGAWSRAYPNSGHVNGHVSVRGFMSMSMGIEHEHGHLGIGFAFGAWASACVLCVCVHMYRLFVGAVWAS